MRYEKRVFTGKGGQVVRRGEAGGLKGVQPPGSVSQGGTRPKKREKRQREGRPCKMKLPQTTPGDKLGGNSESLKKEGKSYGKR